MKMGLGHKLAFHCVVSGHCVLKVGSRTLSLSASELVLLPEGDNHQLLSEPSAQARSTSELFGNKSAQEIRQMTHGGAGPTCELICGTLKLNPWGQQLLSHTAPVIRIDISSTPTISAILGLIHTEQNLCAPGYERSSSCLMEAALIQLFRLLIDQPDSQLNTLKALADPMLSPALAAIHNRPDNHWTLIQLAALTHRSTATFNRHFKAAMGISPIRYLNRWRVYKASETLKHSNASVLNVALEYGFQSADVFIRNFRQQMGLTPGEYRKQQRQLSEDRRPPES